MDVPTANQSQTPYQPCAGQNGWSPASAQGSPCNPLPGFQHLSIDSPSDRRPCYDHLQASNWGCHSNITTVSSRNDAHSSKLQPYNAGQTLPQMMPDAHVSSMLPAASQGRLIPPCSLPLLNKGAQPCKTHEMPFNSTHSLYQAMSSPFQPSYTHQSSQNGPRSAHKEHLPISSPSFGQCGKQNPLCSPQPAFGRADVDSSVGYMQNLASPTSPIQHQPPWTLPPHSIGRFICNMYMTCLHVWCRAFHGSGPFK